MTDSNQRLNANFHKLCDAQNCTGCLACYNACKYNAILIKEDKEGFVYPLVQSELCIGCGMCERVCPIMGDRRKNPVADMAYAAWTKDKETLFNSSSGGLYSEIARCVLKKGGVVFGAAFDKEWNVRHFAVSNENELSKTQGSKYVQSYIGTSFQAVEKMLSLGETVLFSGTPCQISGLKSYLSLVKCKTDSLYTIDLVCHGVPSPTIFKSYTSYLEKLNHSKLLYFTFRNKKWSWYRYNQKATFTNNQKYFGKWETDPFIRGFLREYYLRSSCHQCVFATEQRCGDFTLCDYWGYYKKPGEVDNNDMGVSLVIPNTEKARELYKSLTPFVVSYGRDVQEAMKSNQAFHKCFSASPLRGEFWKDFHENGFEGVIEKYLFPEEIQPHFQKVYKYGRTGGKIIGSIDNLANKAYNKLRRIKRVFFE